MTGHFGIPGVGGSLGKCAVCGDAFVKEILMGESVESFSVGGIEQTLYAHDKCVLRLKQVADGNKDWKELPEGPLRTAFQEADERQKKGEPCDERRESGCED